MVKLFEKTKTTWNQTDIWVKVALVAFVLNFFMVSQLFFPHMQEINIWDEADYVNSGRLFVEGQWVSFSWNPLVAMLYAILYLFTRHLPFWFLESIALGRIVLFTLLWLATLLIAKKVEKHIHPMWLIGIAFITPLFTDIFKNPSDALFAAMSGFAFWKLLSFIDDRSNSKSLLEASAFLGLAALSRNDGLVLFLIVVLLTFILTWQAKRSLVKWGLAICIPFWVIVGGYVLLFWGIRGTFEFGTSSRSYIAFMQGHQIVYTRTPDCTLSFQKCAVADAIQKYGSPEENNNSIFRAIMRNPIAFLERVQKIMLTLPETFYQAYGIRLAYVYLFFALIGIIALFFAKKFLLLFTILFWPAYLGVYFLTFFRPGYLQSPYFVLFILVGFGLDYFIKQIITERNLGIWSSVMVLLIVVGVWAKLPSLYFTATILMAAFFMILLIQKSGNFAAETVLTTGMLILFVSGILMRGNYPGYVGRVLGEIPEERAILEIQRSFAPNTLIAAGGRGVVYAATMRHFSLGSDTLLGLSPEALYYALKEQNVQGIYVDGTLSNQNKAIWLSIEKNIGTGYETLYTDETGSIRVLKLIP